MRDYTCAGCERTHRYYSGKKPVLCEDCRRAIKEYPELIKAIHVDENKIIVMGKEVDYAYPYIFLHGHNKYEPEFAEIFHQLVEKLSVKVNWDDVKYVNRLKRFFTEKDFKETGNPRGSSEWDIPIFIDKEIMVLLHDLYMLVKRMVLDQYNYGKSAGKNLLVSLNSGDISISDFDESLKPDV